MSSHASYIVADVPIIEHDRHFLSLFIKTYPFNLEANATFACRTESTSDVYYEGAKVISRRAQDIWWRKFRYQSKGTKEDVGRRIWVRNG